MLKKAFIFAILRGKTTLFSKNAENQRAKLIFSKWAKILLFNFGLFQQVFEIDELDETTADIEAARR